ncbi:hypothetical protein FQN49_000283 [Arthroderma sp. PD_2]|nr:hypothetical protein FQN49_000283 [Arthroderma sp. PD_2]
MEQLSDSDMQQREEEVIQREFEMKERRRRQNRIAQRNHRKRKYQQCENERENSSQRCRDEIDVQFQAGLTSKHIQQISDDYWLKSLGLVSLDQRTALNPLGPVNTTGPHEKIAACPSPPGSSSPSNSLPRVECLNITKDNRNTATACIRKQLDGDHFDGPIKAVDLHSPEESAQLLSLFAAGPGSGLLFSETGPDTDWSPYQLDNWNLPQEALESFGSCRQALQIPEPEISLNLPRRRRVRTVNTLGSPNRTDPHTKHVDSDVRHLGHSLRGQIEERGGELEGKIALHLSAEEGHVGIVACLIRHGSDISKQDKSGATALHYAAKMGNVGVATILLANGADASAKDFQGQTPLHMAAKNGHEDAVQLLVEAGVDVDIQI